MDIKKFVYPEIKLDKEGFHFINIEGETIIDEEEQEGIREEIIVDPMELFIGPPMPTLITFTPTQLERVKQEQYLKGYNTGYDKANEELSFIINAKLDQENTILSSINFVISGIESEIEQRINKELPKLVQLSQIIAEKIASYELNQNYQINIKKAIEQILGALNRSTNFVIQVNSTHIEFIKKIVEAMKRSNSKVGVEIIENPDISLYDCKIEWKNGLFSYNLKERMFDIDNILLEVLEINS